MVILGKTLLSFLAYAFIMNVILLLVRFPQDDKIGRLLSWSCGMSWFVGGILGIIWTIMEIWL